MQAGIEIELYECSFFERQLSLKCEIEYEDLLGTNYRQLCHVTFIVSKKPEKDTNRYDCSAKVHCTYIEEPAEFKNNRAFASTAEALADAIPPTITISNNNEKSKNSF